MKKYLWLIVLLLALAVFTKGALPYGSAAVEVAV